MQYVVRIMDKYGGDELEEAANFANTKEIRKRTKHLANTKLEDIG